MKEKEAIQYFDNIYPNEEKFRQAFHTYLPYLLPELKKNEAFRKAGVLERLLVPEKVIKFRVNWVDDKGELHVNRGFRVQMSSTLGPYKGGLRFSPSVNEDVFLFLAFKQTFKNALTGLPLGSGKGGSDFDPKGKSDMEMMRFCQQFMLELHSHIGKITDVPAGDIGVSSREIGYMYGYYRKLNNVFSGSLTGKDPDLGGIKLRKEATGYGLVYFLNCMMQEQKLKPKDAKVLISGAGNVAYYAAEKLIEMDCKVLTLSDSQGVIFKEKGFTKKDLEKIKVHKLKRRALAEISNADWDYEEGKKSWQFEGNIALPCATENELDEKDANKLLKKDIRIVAEGANMPATSEAAKAFIDAKVAYGPDIAANSGGVFVSGLEMAQNASLEVWRSEDVDKRLKKNMENIHAHCQKKGKSGNYIHYEKGAIRWSFERIAKAMLGQGIV